MYTYVFFDVDGTLVDSTEVLLSAFKAAYNKLNLTYPGDDIIQEQFGKDLISILHYLEIPPAMHDSFKTKFTEVELNSDDFKLIDGMDDVLEFIRAENKPIVLVTSKRSQTTSHMLDAIGLSDQVDVLVTADMVDTTKPDPEPLLLACEKLNIDPDSSVLYIGDSVHDIIAARSADITPKGVLWGVHEKELREQFDQKMLINTVDELMRYLEYHLKQE